MKFSEMPYQRLDADALKAQLAQLTQELQEAKDYAAARNVFLKRAAGLVCPSHASLLEKWMGQ